MVPSLEGVSSWLAETLPAVVLWNELGAVVWGSGGVPVRVTVQLREGLSDGGEGLPYAAVWNLHMAEGAVVFHMPVAEILAWSTEETSTCKVVHRSWLMVFEKIPFIF